MIWIGTHHFQLKTLKHSLWTLSSKLKKINKPTKLREIIHFRTGDTSDKVQSPADPAMAGAQPLHRKVPTTSRWSGGFRVCCEKLCSENEKDPFFVVDQVGAPSRSLVPESIRTSSPQMHGPSTYRGRPGKWRSTCWHWDDCGKRGEVPFLLSYVSGETPMSEWPGGVARKLKKNMWPPVLLVLKPIQSCKISGQHPDSISLRKVFANTND